MKKKQKLNKMVTKKKKVIMLPTENESKMMLNTRHDVLWTVTEFLLNQIKRFPGDFKFQHLYIINDEEIKEGDWFNATNKLLGEGVFQCTGINKEGHAISSQNYFPDAKKIIATTDKSLIKYIPGARRGLKGPASLSFNMSEIGDSYTEEYCKNPVDEVLLEYEVDVLSTKLANLDNHVKGWDMYLPENAVHRLKVNSNNEVIIHPVKERVYSREEMIHAITYTHGEAFYKHRTHADVLKEYVDKYMK